MIAHPARRSYGCPASAAGLLALLCLGAVGCQSYSERLDSFRASYIAGDLISAREDIDTLIAEESGVDYDVVMRSDGREDTIDVGSDDTWLLLLEKSMFLLAREDPEAALLWLRRSRDHMDSLLSHNVEDYFDEVASAIRDDTSRVYHGADYEHVMTRCMLAICSLLLGDGDAFAYALQIGEIQERIIGSPFGEDQGYKPREKYRRVAFGAYLQGVIHELNLAADEALRSYERAKQYAGENPEIDAAIARIQNNEFAAQGEGVLHVFYLAGQGPRLVETNQLPTELATRLAGVGIAIAADTPSALVQAPVPVPVVQAIDIAPQPLAISAAGRGPVQTRTVLDVNRTAREQLDANLPWIIARAMVRRALKAAASAAVEYGVREAMQDGGRDHRGADAAADVVGFLAGAATNLTLTATESADTRSWSCLPAQIQVARLALPEGTHNVSLGGSMQANVRVSAGYDSYVVVVRPGLHRTGTVLVDRFSRPGAGTPQKQPATAEAEDLP